MKLFFLIVLFAVVFNSQAMSYNNCDTVKITSVFVKTEPTCTTPGAIQVYVTGGSGNYQYSVNDEPYASYANGVITGLTAGNYCIRVQDVNDPTCGTAESGNIMLRNSPGQLAVTATPTPSNWGCSAVTPDGRLSVTATDGTGVNTYYVNDIAEPLLSGLGGTLFNMPEKEYIVKVVDGSGCIATSEKVRITSAGQTSLSISNLTNTTCGFSNGAATFTATISGAYSYQLNNEPVVAMSSTAIHLTGLSAGVHTLRIFNDCGEATQTFPIGNGANGMAFTPLVTPEMVSCTDILIPGKIRIIADKGNLPYQYRIDGGAWIPFPNNQSNQTTILASEGLYTVEVKDGANCTYEISRICVTREPYKPVKLNSVFVSTQPTCTTPGTIQVYATGGSEKYQYSVNGESYSNYANGEITGLTAGNYYIKVQDADHPTCGTELSGNIMLYNPPGELAVSVTATPSASCTTGAGTGTLNVTVTGGNADYSYTVNGNAEPALNGTGGTLTNLDAKEYIVGVQDGNGCKATSEKIRITATPLTLSAPALGTATCKINNGSANFTVGGFSGSYQYQLDNHDIITMTAGALHLSQLNAGVHTLRVFNNCDEITTTFSIGFGIINFISFTETITPEEAVCATLTPGAIEITPNGWFSPFQYRIDGDLWNDIPASSITIPATEGLYTIEVKDVTDCTYEKTRIRVVRQNYSPLLDLTEPDAGQCDMAPVHIPGNTFGGTATCVTLTTDGAGTLTPTTTTTSPFTIQYVPDASDEGKTVTITVSTDAVAPCAAKVKQLNFTVHSKPAIKLKK